MMNTLTDSPSTPQSKKRPREDETPSQRIKREKAAERQRRKRERDRAGLAASAIHPHIDMDGLAHQPNDYAPPRANPADQDLTPDEIVRRDRVRAAARERQRKHRALVKQRKLEQLGMLMGNDGMQQDQAMHDSDVAYRGVAPPEAQYLPPELHHTPPPPPPHLDGQPGEPSLPHIQGNGGQMFATTLLLSFSCAPLLKQHLLNNLQMTNEELASLEPIIADAWDQWDRQVRFFPQYPAVLSLTPYSHSAVNTMNNMVAHLLVHTMIHTLPTHLLTSVSLLAQRPLAPSMEPSLP